MGLGVNENLGLVNDFLVHLEADFLHLGYGYEQLFTFTFQESFCIGDVLLLALALESEVICEVLGALTVELAQEALACSLSAVDCLQLALVFIQLVHLAHEAYEVVFVVGQDSESRGVVDGGLGCGFSSAHVSI